MNIRARLTNVGLHALASSLIVSGLLPMRVLAADSVGGFPPLSYTTKHAADAATQTIRMTSSASVDSAITSITAIAPNSFSPVEVDGEPSCENPLYAALCQEIKESNDGWETIYSGSGTTSQTIYGAYTHWRATVSYNVTVIYGWGSGVQENVKFSKNFEGAKGEAFTIEASTAFHPSANPRAIYDILKRDYTASVTDKLELKPNYTSLSWAIGANADGYTYCIQSGSDWYSEQCKANRRMFGITQIKVTKLDVYR
ncbi:hypothetical protein KW429_11285 [Vibrio fluvialis]|nr:hypothetical protein [Vibrio fluvialis]